jgi:hypothetical protein
MTELESLALKHGTDKSSHGYCPHYEHLIGHLRLLPITMIEIGVGNGDSLRMWRDWMPKAKIYAMDINNYDIKEDFTILKGNQSSTDDLENLVRTTGKFHFLVDDAGHNRPEQKICYKYMFERLVSGGWYVIEDLDDISNIYDFDLQSDVEELHMIRAKGGARILFLKKQ